MELPRSSTTASVPRRHFHSHLLSIFLVTIGCQNLQVSRKPVELPETLPAVPVFSSRQEMTEMEARLKKQLLDNPEDAVAHWQLAYTLDQQGLSYPAAKSYERALELAPQLHPARVHYARLLWKRGEIGRALSEVDFVIKRDKDMAEAYAVRGLILKELGRNDLAVEAFQSGWRCRPPSVEAGYALAQWDLARGYTQAAADRLRLCLIYEPNRADYRLTYAETLTALNRRAEAIQQWEHLANSGEGGARPYLELASLYVSSGRGEQARDALDHARRLDPQAPQLAKLERQISTVPFHKPIQEFRPLLASNPR